MRHRGEKFWVWSDPVLHHRYHDEELSDGTNIDVQVRLSRTGETQLFIGVYGKGGLRILEEAYDSRPGETMSKAQAWGLERARSYARETTPIETFQTA